MARVRSRCREAHRGAADWGRGQRDTEGGPWSVKGRCRDASTKVNRSTVVVKRGKRTAAKEVQCSSADLLLLVLHCLCCAASHGLRGTIVGCPVLQH